MADFYDVSNWNEKPWFGTKGSRDKSVMENPETRDSYYFKTSLSKPLKDYKHEFWSEIIASEIGQLLELNILRYDIAYNAKQIGCISKFMNKEGESELTEGVQYLTGFNSAYNPEIKESHKDYTFQFIRDALISYGFKKYLTNIIQIIIFDSIIGNGDRHQENWGIITYNKEAIDLYEKEARKVDNSLWQRIILRVFVWGLKKFPNYSTRTKIKIHELIPNRFAPIYDSGSCLGREIIDERVSDYLHDPQRLRSYINKGKSEIHWENKKLSHFDLIKRISEEYPEEIKNEIDRIRKLFTTPKVEIIVNEIDKNLPSQLNSFKLPELRKQMIIKMITLRFESLMKIFS